jgi:hypothetical protein
MEAENRKITTLLTQQNVSEFTTLDWLELAGCAMEYAKTRNTVEDSICEAVDLLDFDSLIFYAKLYGCNANPEEWLDDDYPAKESELRDELARK